MTIRPAISRLALAVFVAVTLCASAGARADDAAGPGTSAARAPEPAEADLRPREVRGLSVKNTLGQQIPLGLTFTNVDNSQVALSQLFNRPSKIPGVKKPVVLMMVYFRCPILCPMVLEKFTKTLNEIDYTVGSEYDAVVVSFDWRDKPEDAVIQRANQLLFYRQPTTDEVRNGWTFLTCAADPKQAQQLADSLGFEYRYLPNVREFAHGSAVYILTPEGKVARVLTGLNYPASDVRLALLEASQGKIGTLFDKFTLWCYHFDPSAGTYSLQAMRVMQVGASLCAIILGSLIFGLFRWERRKARRLAAEGAPGAAHAVELVRHASAPASPALLGPAGNEHHRTIATGLTGTAR